MKNGVWGCVIGCLVVFIFAMLGIAALLFVGFLLLKLFLHKVSAGIPHGLFPGHIPGAAEAGKIISSVLHFLKNIFDKIYNIVPKETVGHNV